MLKDNTKILIFVLTILIIILVMIQIFQSRSSDSPTTRVKKTEEQSSRNQLFYIVRNTAPTKPVNVVQQFTVIFSQPLSYNSLQYEISPQTDLTLSLDNTGKFLTIAPKINWLYDTTYTLKIKRDTTDINGKTLNNDAIIYFSTGPYVGI